MVNTSEDKELAWDDLGGAIKVLAIMLIPLFAAFIFCFMNMIYSALAYVVWDYVIPRLYPENMPPMFIDYGRIFMYTMPVTIVLVIMGFIDACRENE